MVDAGLDGGMDREDGVTVADSLASVAGSGLDENRGRRVGAVLTKVEGSGRLFIDQGASTADVDTNKSRWRRRDNRC